MTTPAKVSTFSVKPANTCTFTYAYVAADGAYGRVAINASGGLPVYTLTALTPYADDTNALGTSALRWNSLLLALDGVIDFDDGAGNTNRFVYTDGTGPTWTDKTVSESLTFNLQAFTGSHVATWQDSAGTVAWLSDVDDAVANLYAAPSLVTLDHTAGGSFTAGLGVPSVVFVTSDNAAPIVGTTTIGATAGDLTAGWELVVTFIVASTTVAHSSAFTSTGGLTLAVTATAGQSFRYIWDTGVSKYKRYS